MSQKQKLIDIVAKLKSWAESSGDETLDEHIKELETEINASFTAQDDDESEGGGGNHPPYQPGKP